MHPRCPRRSAKIGGPNGCSHGSGATSVNIKLSADRWVSESEHAVPIQVHHSETSGAKLEFRVDIEFLIVWLDEAVVVSHRCVSRTNYFRRGSSVNHHDCQMTAV